MLSQKEPKLQYLDTVLGTGQSAPPQPRRQGGVVFRETVHQLRQRAASRAAGQERQRPRLGPDLDEDDPVTGLGDPRRALDPEEEPPMRDAALRRIDLERFAAFYAGDGVPAEPPERDGR